MFNVHVEKCKKAIKIIDLRNKIGYVQLEFVRCLYPDLFKVELSQSFQKYKLYEVLDIYMFLLMTFCIVHMFACHGFTRYYAHDTFFKSIVIISSFTLNCF